MYDLWDKGCQNIRCPGANVERDGTNKVVSVTKTQMEYCADLDFWYCPVCGSEIWGAIEEDDKDGEPGPVEVMQEV